MSQPIISIPMWVALPYEVRHRIRMIFHIPRSSNTVVTDGVVDTDGVTHEDLKSLTIPKMQSYLNNESTDFHKLFDLVVAKVNDDMNGIKEIVTVGTDSSVTVILDEPKKRGRPKMKKNV